VTAILTAQNLSIGYRHGRDVIPVAERLNFELNAGELVCLIGANGIGKSTLMRTLAGMQPTLRGTICIGDRSIQSFSTVEFARQVSIVLTERLDVGLLTGRELIALGRHPYTDWLGRLTTNDHDTINRAIAAVGASALADRPFSELSDGERQKILIGRALAQSTPIMMLDEPTAFLDVPRRAEIIYMLRALAHTTQRAILLSTHDLDLALRTADRLWLFGANHQIYRGAPEDVVLSGAFESAFADPHSRFNIDSGSFLMSEHRCGIIHVIGNGTRTTWTRRALERTGFQIDDNALDTVEVLADSWRGVVSGQPVNWATLGDMNAWFREKTAE